MGGHIPRDPEFFKSKLAPGLCARASLAVYKVSSPSGALGEQVWEHLTQKFDEPVAQCALPLVVQSVEEVRVL
jgi:hypothetical protein